MCSDWINRLKSARGAEFWNPIRNVLGPGDLSTSSLHDPKSRVENRNAVNKILFENLIVTAVNISITNILIVWLEIFPLPEGFLSFYNFNRL
jgi:hypothetical protein